MGGAILERRLPVDVDTPRGVKREADDDRLLKDSENDKHLNFLLFRLVYFCKKFKDILLKLSDSRKN